MQTIHTKAGFKVLRESLGLYQSDVAEAAGVDVKTVKNWESPRRREPAPLPWHGSTSRIWRKSKSARSGAWWRRLSMGRMATYPPLLPRAGLSRGRGCARRGSSNAMTRKVAFELTRLVSLRGSASREEARTMSGWSEIWICRQSLLGRYRGGASSY